MSIVTVEGSSTGSHQLALAAQPSGLMELTVVLNHQAGRRFGLLAYVVREDNRAAWIGEPPLMQEGFTYGGSFSLHTGNDPVEQAFGIIFAGSKRVSNTNGLSTNESRLKISLDPVHKVRDIMLVVAAKPNEYADVHARGSVTPLALRHSPSITIVEGNNDSMALAENGMQIRRFFGEHEKGTWFIPGIIRVDASGHITVETGSSFFGGTDHNSPLPYLDRDGNFMRVTSPVNSRR